MKSRRDRIGYGNREISIGVDVLELAGKGGENWE
jgi:hypothetical protein